jgi:7-cyano-7-deazaguanine synthase
MMLDSVVIVSGGLDSVTLLHHLVKTSGLCPAVLTFQYGQKHSKEVKFAQIQAASLGCHTHQLVDLSVLEPLFRSSALVSQEIAVPDIDQVLGDDQPATYVPNRNMIFLALAAAYAETMGVQDIYYGAQSHDMYGYWDTTSAFVQRLNRVLGLNRQSPVQVHAPFVDKSKTDIVRLGLALDVDYALTWSCYLGEELACGRCPTCAERLKAFENAGLPDPLPYA